MDKMIYSEGSKTDAVFYIVRGEAFLFSNQWKQKSSHGRRPKNQKSSYQVSLASQTPTDFESGRNDCNGWDGGTILTKSISPGGTPHNSEESQSNINSEMLLGNLKELSIYPTIAQKSSFMRLAAIPCQIKTLIFHL